MARSEYAEFLELAYGCLGKVRSFFAADAGRSLN